jgi:hypothetical protein
MTPTVNTSQFFSTNISPNQLEERFVDRCAD